MTFFTFFLKKISDFLEHLDNESSGNNCSWCGKTVGRINLKRIWYTETADDVCDLCLNPPQSVKFIRGS